MTLVVQKYGGTSVANPERLRHVAARIATAHREGIQLLVVVSAMADTTDRLLELADSVNPDPPGREIDMLLTAGERISMALLAMALAVEDVPAVSFTGSQAGILTDTLHGAARITGIRGDRVASALKDGRVVIVAGFQGVSPDTKDVTTLGRGGSDASAVALAAAHGAEVCEIYTDVDGVFTADPRIYPQARKLDEVPYDDMLELAASGTGVMMTRAVEFGRRFNIPIHVRSSFGTEPGTWVKEATMEQAMITAVAHDTSEAKLTISKVPDRPGVAAELFEALAAEDVVIDTIVQNVSSEGLTDISFTVPRDVAQRAASAAGAVSVALGAGEVDLDLDIAKVSLVGAAMKNESGVAGRVFRALASEGINIEMISTSTIRISCVIRGDRVEDAVRALAEEFELGSVGAEVGA